MINLYYNLVSVVSESLHLALDIVGYSFRPLRHLACVIYFPSKLFIEAAVDYLLSKGLLAQSMIFTFFTLTAPGLNFLEKGGRIWKFGSSSFGLCLDMIKSS